MKYNDKELFEDADKFIALANGISLEKGEANAASAVLYGASRYMAYVVSRTAKSNRKSPAEMVSIMLQTMHEQMWHHLAQMPHFSLDEVAPESGALYTDNPSHDQLMVEESFARFQKSFSAIDVCVTAYLRGGWRA